jgi:hypothetical protein
MGYLKKSLTSFQSFHFLINSRPEIITPANPTAIKKYPIISAKVFPLKLIQLTL